VKGSEGVVDDYSRIFLTRIRFSYVSGVATTSAFDIHVIKKRRKDGKQGQMKTGAKQRRGGNPQSRHFIWTNSDQIRPNPAKKIKKSFAPPPPSLGRAEVFTKADLFALVKFPIRVYRCSLAAPTYREGGSAFRVPRSEFI
jgi:hypothetical protein